MGLFRSALELIVSCFVYSLIVAFASFVIVFLIAQDLERVSSVFPLVLLLEGGLGLAAGGAVASFSPTVEKVSESLFHTKPWDAKRQKEAEKQARIWIVTGILLISMGLLTSAL